MPINNQLLIEITGIKLKEIAPQASIFVYGSRARGDFREDSDLDLMILLPESMTKKEQIEIRERIHYTLYDLSVELNYEVDFSPVVIPENIFFKRKTPFTINVLNEGIKL